ncbi:hypothetical protein R1flu_014267 [Riccia fluitans]|uniref:soluble epoxide hydrolase n=1 Tax=Riccia fluitans TaxID=41844 RepID=A0ABD1YFM2_9MARC
MGEISHRIVEANGIKMHIAEQGKGPLVLLLHGFPSLWYTWRHQIPVIANAGYHVVAPDMRGFGQTEAPEDPTKYTFLNTVGDVVSLIHTLGEKQACLVGHDWGALVTWLTALLRPDVVKCVVTLNVSFLPRDPKYSILDQMRAMAGERVYAMEWQEPGKAEADLERDIKQTFEKLYAYRTPELLTATESKSVLENMPAPEKLPAWITDEDIKVYVETFSKTGFTGGLNWYRNLDRSWELLAPWTGLGISVPGFVIVGDVDLSAKFTRSYLESPRFKADCPNGEYKFIPGCAHFIQEEAPEVINNLILEYLKRH